MAGTRLKHALRQTLPPKLLRRYDRLRLEAPFRIRDFPADLRDRLWPSAAHPVPPAQLRAHIGRTSSRDEYLRVGRAGFEQLLAAFNANRDAGGAYPRWLDFGCGCGRICRYLPLPGTCESIVGADVDKESIRWNARHLPRGEFLLLAPLPPAPLPSAGFDVIYAISVFTHLDEAPQLSWLEELTRLLRAGGLLLASTHGEQLAPTRPDLSSSQRTRLAADGFAFAPGAASFNDHTAFHSRSYLERNWSRNLTLLAFQPYGLFGYQDLSVWKKPDGGLSNRP